VLVGGLAAAVAPSATASRQRQQAERGGASGGNDIRVCGHPKSVQFGICGFEGGNAGLSKYGVSACL